jgi:hypothetical protein
MPRVIRLCDHRVMGWRRQDYCNFELDSHTSMRALFETEFSDQRFLMDLAGFTLLVIPAKAGESVSEIEGVGWDAVRLGSDLRAIEHSLPSEVEPIQRALGRVLVNETASLPELDALLEGIQTELDTAGAEYQTNYKRLSSGHELVFVIIAAATQVAGTIVSWTALQASLRRARARSRCRRLIGREAEAVRETRKYAARSIKGSENWDAREVALDKDVGAFKVTLVHPKDARKALEEARWANFEVRPGGGDHLDVDLLRSNRLGWGN